MTEPPQGQLKEFWQWCGLEVIYAREFDIGVDLWRLCKNLDGVLVEIWRGQDLQQAVDLNNLFKYAVPQLVGVNLERNYSVENSSLWDADVCAGAYWEQARNVNPALALFWAIWSVAGLDKGAVGVVS